ncbi:hypothetical protein M8J77_007700 [Diaphorina citri]|nr:hypothetical protein M8J77_007700 [Diaphorina citri]
MDANGSLSGGVGGGAFRNGMGGPTAGMGKKMRKRKELDALVSHPCLTSGVKRLSLARARHDELIGESTDDEFYWSSTSGPRSGVSGNVRFKRGGAKKRSAGRRDSWRFGFFRACSVVLVFTCVLTTCCVLYLFLDIRQQCAYLRHELDEVVAGSQGVPDALQRSLSLSKQLERNQTDLVAKFNLLSVQIRNFSIQISELHGTISAVQDKLAASPQVLDVPARLKELSDNVAGFGSTLNDLTNTVNQEKEAGAKARLEATAVKADVAALKTSLENVRNQTGVTRTHLTSVQQDLTSLTLSVSSITRDLALLNTTLQSLRGDLAGVNASLASSQAVMVTQGVDGQKVAGPAMSSQSAQTPVNGGTAVPPALPMPSNIKSVESEPPIPELEVTSRPAVLKVTSRSSNEQGSQGINKPV